MQGLQVVCIIRFFSFNFNDTLYPCALVCWFSCIGDEPDMDTGMCMVEPMVQIDRNPDISIIHLDCIVRLSHLIGVHGDEFLPQDFKFFPFP